VPTSRVFARSGISLFPPFWGFDSRTLVDRHELGGCGYPKTYAERIPLLDVQTSQKEFLLAIA
jgi:hypothetical protein